MIMKSNQQHSDTLYMVISAAFCVIVVLSNIISAKMLRVPYFDNFSIPAGLITYPLTFLLSDLTTEIYGSKKAKLMVYIALGMAILSCGIIQGALMLPNADKENQQAFESILGVHGIIIFSSLVAYVIAQILDIQLYALIKKWTGERFLWIRNNGSTLVSQIADTITVNLIFLKWGLGMEMKQVILIMVFSYLYKAFFSLACTPLFYLMVWGVKESWKIPRYMIQTS